MDENHEDRAVDGRRAIDKDFMETVRAHMRTEEERELQRVKHEAAREARQEQRDIATAQRVEKVEVDLRALSSLVLVAKGFVQSVRMAIAVMGVLITVIAWVIIDKNSDIKVMQAQLVTHSVQIDATLQLLKSTVSLQEKDMTRLDQHVDKDSENFLDMEKRSQKSRN